MMHSTVSTNIADNLLKHRHILGMRVDVVSYEDAVRLILTRGSRGEGGYVCAANVHMAMEAYDSRDFQDVVNSAELVTPDGMPLVWALRILGVRQQERVCGPDLILHLLESAAAEGVPVGLYGGSPEVLDKLSFAIKSRYPSVNIVYAYSPPFRPMTIKEDMDETSEIAASGARLLFVGLGCPKQEQWMNQHKQKLKAVQIGVGAAFDFIAGTKRRAPRWMRNIGLEWLFRLLTEPRRLTWRYFKNNPRFLFFFVVQLIKIQMAERKGILQ